MENFGDIVVRSGEKWKILKGVLVKFRGLNAINVDAKGRMAMPKKFRAPLETLSQGQLVVTIDVNDPCLLIYPYPQWEKIEENLASLPNMDPAVKRLQRLLLGHATELEMDAQGRVLLPALLRDYAQIEKQAYLVGQGNKFELWDQETWNRQRDLWLAEAQMDEIEPSPHLNEISL